LKGVNINDKHMEVISAADDALGEGGRHRRHRWSQMQERIDDYLAFGVRHVWVIDPRSRKAYEFTSEGMHEVKELRTPEPQISIPLPMLFE